MKTRRTALTLIEVLLATTLAVMVMGTLTATLTGVLQSQHTAARHVEGLKALAALGQQWRRDVHESQSVELPKPDAPAQTLNLALTAERVVEYTLAPEGLVRLARGPGQPDARETYYLPGMRPLGWNADAQASGILSLTVGILARQGDDPEAVRRRFTLDAALVNLRREAAP